MPSPDDHWLDEEAGPVVRPYALTRGRTRPSGETLDLIAIITAVRGVQVDPSALDPEHLAVLRLCRLPASVADLAADLDLPLGVVRILLGDLQERSLVTIHHPIPPARLPDVQILKEVVDGLRRL
ncbi:MAG TPA: DUF742 domain-containing protein [Streptosporangiaceae bacterium]|jgi:hypothetical protein|nr:DUF742 domain-containing protein [Streptosporangiaceae bacterium]